MTALERILTNAYSVLVRAGIKTIDEVPESVRVYVENAIDEG